MSENDLETTPINSEADETFRSGVVAVIGRPNVGKSTLINALLEQKIAITTPKPQTTRRQQLGILTDEDGRGQILFVDTPGLHRARNKLGEYMMAMAERAFKDADVILWILDGSEAPGKADYHIAETLKNRSDDTPIVLALNKTDKLKGFVDFTAHLELVEHQTDIKISALEGTKVPELIDLLFTMLPEGPQYYPEDQVSDMNMRFVAAEIVREKVILNTREEVPHSVAVEINSYEEDENTGLHSIFAVIYVERTSQKGIIVGKGGQLIKRIGTEARKDLEEIVEAKVFLDLRVKVLKNWRSNEEFMKRVGYQLPKDED